MSIFKKRSSKGITSVEDKIQTMARVRWACRGIILFATAVSVWGNGLNAKPGDNISMAIEVAPPVFVFLTLELMTRVPLKPGLSRWHWKKWSRPLVLLAIATASVILSYHNQYDAFLPHTVQMSAVMLPGIIDGTMTIALVTLIELNDRIRELTVTQTLNDAKEQAAAERTPRATTRRKATKSERVLKFLDRNPEMPLQQVAQRLEVSYSLVNSVAKKARAQATVDA